MSTPSPSLSVATRKNVASPNGDPSQQESSWSLERDQALEEANEVLKRSNLDGFNLLGVVASPGGAATHSTSAHVESSSSQPPPTLPHAPTDATLPPSSSLGDYTASWEATLSQVTLQIEVLNGLFEDWSRYYLEDSYYYNEKEYHHPLQDQLEDYGKLPDHLAQPLQNMEHLQRYLESCGVLAHAYQQQQTGTTTTEPTSSEQDCTALEQALPDIFFRDDFDLTNPQTFQDLFHLGNATNGSATNGTYNNTAAWELLPPPDAFTGSLDKVELALLQQVHQKSADFFRETNRFSQLKGWIGELTQEVQALRNKIHKVVAFWELGDCIPEANRQSKQLQQLQHVLEAAMEVIRIKSSIGGLLSAHQDLQAVEQIQYARLLLAGNTHPGEPQQQQQLPPLHQLTCLQPLTHQLTQYEDLVVTNLGDELVEAFLGWSNRNHNNTRIQDIYQALQQCKALPKTAALYITRLQTVLRMTVRTTVGEFATETSSTTGVNVSGMTLEGFLDCLDLVFEQLIQMMQAAKGVDEFAELHGWTFVNDDNDTTPQSSDSTTNGTVRVTRETIATAAELCSKSIAELLRLRKEAHSLVSLEEMKQLWDKCHDFTHTLEDVSGTKASVLRSTLLAQAKAFVERKHESHMSSLVAALDSERWTQCEVSAERQAALTRLCSGRAMVPPTKRKDGHTTDAQPKQPDAEVEGVRYKVVWSCLLLIEMVMTNLLSASHFNSLTANVVGKVSELLRLFNSRATQLVLGAGAIHSAARLKSINAKHLSLVTQCLGLVIAVLPHIRGALMALLPTKQHMLLTDLDRIKNDYREHNEKVLNKFVTIIGGIVEHGLAPRIASADFDARAKQGKTADGKISCCVFLEGVSTNTRKMHQVLSSLLPPNHLQDVFSRIFAYVDQKVPALLIASAAAPTTPLSASGRNSPTAGSKPSFRFPVTDPGKERLLLEVQSMTQKLNGLSGVQPWDFTAVAVFERKLDYQLSTPVVTSPTGDASREDATAPPAAESNEAEEENPGPAALEEPSPATPNGVDSSADASTPNVPDEPRDEPGGGSTPVSSAEDVGDQDDATCGEHNTSVNVDGAAANSVSTPSLPEEDKEQ